MTKEQRQGIEIAREVVRLVCDELIADEETCLEQIVNVFDQPEDADEYAALIKWKIAGMKSVRTSVINRLSRQINGTGKKLGAR